MYLWIKAAHVVAVIAWMAAILYMPRLMVYHASAEPGSVQSETFKVMERRLMKAIMTPAMVAVWVLGIWLAVLSGAWSQGWLHAKLVAVLGISAMHGIMVRWVRDFAADANTRSPRYFRIANEIPTVLMIAAVVLVIVKPF